jgi:hypothetical protein
LTIPGKKIVILGYNKPLPSATKALQIVNSFFQDNFEKPASYKESSRKLQRESIPGERVLKYY